MSWVIREKATGKVLFETFNPKVVKALNTAKYEAVEIGGQDVTRLIGDSHLMEEIAEAVESSWVAP